MAENAELIARLKAEALTQGFADIGITTADAIPQAGARLKAWLADGCHGDMIWMPDRADERADIRFLEVECQRLLGRRGGGRRSGRGLR